MDTAFDNYLQLSNILQADMNALLDDESSTQHRRRNFIRVSAALIEGYAHCIREMCAVSFDCEAPKLTKDESQVLQSEESFDAGERIKFTLRAAYKLFELKPDPDFGVNEWLLAQKALAKRHSFMHPKTPADLEVPDEVWNEIHEGVAWMMKQLFSFFSLLQQKYGG